MARWRSICISVWILSKSFFILRSREIEAMIYYEDNIDIYFPFRLGHCEEGDVFTSQQQLREMLDFLAE